MSVLFDYEFFFFKDNSIFTNLYNFMIKKQVKN